MESRSDFEESIRIINPTLMNSAENGLLSFLFTSYPVNFFLKNAVYAIPADLPQKLKSHFLESNKFKLTHTLIRRSRKRDPKEYRCEVYGDEIGRGHYGVVNKLIGTLALNDDMTFVFKTETQRVAKNSVVIYHSPGEFETQKRLITAQVNQEWKMLNLDESFGVKEPLFFDNKYVDYHKEFVGVLIMKFIEGKNLYEILQNTRNISTDDRIKISIAVLRASQWVHEFEIRHGDIKPSNILARLNCSFYSAKVIDWMGCQPMNEKNNDDVYTPIYAPQEITKTAQTSKEGDYYSGGVCLYLILGGSRHPIYDLEERYNRIQKEKEGLAKNNFHTKKEQKYLHKRRDNLNRKQDKIKKKLQKMLQNPSKYYDLNTLFTGIHDLEKNHRSALKNLILQMLSKNPGQRSSFAQALQIIEKIDLERKINKARLKIIDQDLQITAYQHTHSSTIQLRNELDMLARVKSMDQKSIVKMNDLLKKYIKDIPDTQDMIELFVERLQVQAFAKFTFKHDILNTFDQSVDYFGKCFVKFKRLNEEIVELTKDIDIKKTWFDSSDSKIDPIYERLNNLKKELTFLSRKPEKRRVSIDNLFLINKKFKKIDVLVSQVEECRKLFQNTLKEFEETHTDSKDKASVRKAVNKNFKVRIFDFTPPPKDLKITASRKPEQFFKGNK